MGGGGCVKEAKGGGWGAVKATCEGVVKRGGGQGSGRRVKGGRKFKVKT